MSPNCPGISHPEVVSSWSSSIFHECGSGNRSKSCQLRSYVMSSSNSLISPSRSVAPPTSTAARLPIPNSDLAAPPSICYRCSFELLDFESERKWKLAQAKRVAIRASKSIVDYAKRGERKEEEQRLRKVATNISKDVKEFWMKIEKLVFYKYQLELEERKKKALDDQLDFLLGQTESLLLLLATAWLNGTLYSPLSILKTTKGKCMQRLVYLSYDLAKQVNIILENAQIAGEVMTMY
ncbi:protein PHOTOPERIOD-INDEPENDENT EARLY FLOWERING 1-like [Canna indica]|uniref:Protein PHOTOPERIOD-INDEPENDENT EARLY FLOWERING 1-like n=1 Tax=Canna indica TaxID=4628 RepID=A0AAQ3QDP6_9LILI|nr:protein PHOTOPERIOD-INDEPENDENT EARLY FLOWERING 1-like [Canna indica]